MAHNPHSINKVFDKGSFRTTYTARFLLRCAIFIGSIVVFFTNQDAFDVMLGFNFFKHFSVFHILWVMWMFDMVMQLIPSTGYWPLGSQKVFGVYYVPITKRINIHHLKQILTSKQLSKYLSLENLHQKLNNIHLRKHVNRVRLVEFVKTSTRDAYYIAIVWILFIVAFAVANKIGFIDYHIIMLVSVAFYLSDVICVLFWCPFRVFFMKNRCCTTCRIFNWDHLMMFSPFLFIPGFFTWTLSGMTIIIFTIWEITFFVHPERFWEDTNSSLSCRNCTDQLCGKRLAEAVTEAVNNNSNN